MKSSWFDQGEDARAPVVLTERDRCEVLAVLESAPDYLLDEVGLSFASVVTAREAVNAYRAFVTEGITECWVWLAIADAERADSAGECPW